ncbi:acyl-CoA synthetase family protein [Halalkalicoccus jeotgali]|uniref:Acetyl-CoA synthetase n=1 Tax=Halalkalicoccus jeotgali (strain DSM 18796 / CECT 7217 / JCM 14584 / KCTC 4019 / B3) TaxID=795797 RepID=D8J6T4_HALJB|nr:hypothetical protein [Halalkalicoccus jeotgali]ADJ15887.1 hypothetical protein HacjB3_12530 [Halalkalicoccus jeotgali B3]ELY37984.1 hypothetical protein C497_07729 [Halalkalicoccus jeotgali B3]
MDTVGEIVARERRTREPALRAQTGVNLRYDYYQFCTTAHKAGNFFSHRGVRAGSLVGVVREESGAPLLSLFGAALLGARVCFDPPHDLGARLLVAPGEEIETYDLPSGASRLAYAGEARPGVEAFGESVWSENPACPVPPEIGPDTALLEVEDETHTHGELLAAARRVVDRFGIEPGTEVAIRAPLSRPGVVVAGVLAPLLAGGVVLFPGPDETGDLAVGEGSEPDAIRPEQVL